jgi:uncharacterized protein YhaN
LITTRERSPLILDDVTVQCDSQRTARLFDLLREICVFR